MSASNTAESQDPKSDVDARYGLDAEEVQFVSQLTGIKDAKHVKEHLITIEEEAYTIFPYTCISLFEFAKLKISRLPAYADVLSLYERRPGALFLDVGCGTGSDTRKLVADGWPASQIIASDLRAGLWDIGHKTFKSTPETFPVKFIAGDVLDASFLAPTAAIAQSVGVGSPDVSTVTDLTSLRGCLSAIYAYSFFHLFDESQQNQLAQGLASLLSPLPGSTIFGGHVGLPVKGIQTHKRSNGQVLSTFCHSPESWRQLWDGIFGDGNVEVEARLEEKAYALSVLKKVGGEEKFWFLTWSVKRK